MTEAKSILLHIYQHPVTKHLRVTELWFKCITVFLTITFFIKGPYKIPISEQISANGPALLRLLAW